MSASGFNLQPPPPHPVKKCMELRENSSFKQNFANVKKGGGLGVRGGEGEIVRGRGLGGCAVDGFRGIAKARL